MFLDRLWIGYSHSELFLERGKGSSVTDEAVECVPTHFAHRVLWLLGVPGNDGARWLLCAEAGSLLVQSLLELEG